MPDEIENKIPARNASGIASAGGQNKNVQTYADDMAKVMENQEIGMVREIIHQEEEEEKERKNLSPLSTKNMFFMFGSLVFLLLASGIFAYLINSREEIGTVPIQSQFVPLIFTDKTVSIEVANLSKEKIAQSIINEVNASDVKDGGVEEIYLTENKNIIKLPRFFSLIAASTVAGPTGSFTDDFLLGATNQTTKDFFILLKTNSFTGAFNQMRTWETKMFSDLHDFFGVAINADTNYLLSKNFEDGIIQNKNARILYDESHKIMLMYVFADDNSVVIAGTEDAVREVILRLAASTIKK